MKKILIIFASMLLLGCAGTNLTNLPSTFNDAESRAPYKLMAGDEIELIVTQRPDLSGTYTLDPDGTVFFPVGGSVKLEDLTQGEAEQKVFSVLKKFYSPLSLVLKVKSFQSNEFYTVLGEVNRPGVYPMTSRVSLIKAIGMANGLTREADLRRIDLVRNSEDGKRARVNLNKLLIDGDFTYDYIIGKDDIIYVHRNRFYGVMAAVNPIVPITNLGIITYLTIYQIRLSQTLK